MNKVVKLASQWGPVVLLTLRTLWVLQGALALTPGHGVIMQGLNYNAGTVRVGKVISHDMRVINLSAQPVQVEAEPTCGCTIVAAPNYSLAPLHSAVIKAAVDTFGMQSTNQRKSVAISLTSGGRTWQQAALINFRLK